MNDKVKIFISYAREDQEGAKEIHRRLTERSYQPWLDVVDLLPGQDFQLVIEKSLTSSDFVIICLSNTSVAKRSFFQREIKYALDKLKEMRPEDIFVIPARLDDCQMPDELKNRHWVSLFDEREWEKLFRAIDVQLQYRGRFPGTTSTPPPEIPPPRTDFPFISVRLDDRGEVASQTRGRAEGEIEDLGGGVLIEMIRLAGGEFWMGSTEADAQTAFAEAKRYFKDADEKWYKAETPRHRVGLSPFLMGRFPVTQAQWFEVMGDLPATEEKLRGDDHPVVNVSWEEAVEFCQELTRRTGHQYRLPTEAEWEYACRAGTSTPFAFGPTLTPEVANYWWSHPYANGPKKEPLQKTVPVGSIGVANAFGLFDMDGNVWEWCADWYAGSYYQECKSQGVITDPGGPSTGSSRVMRGGSWSYNAVDCRSANRYDNLPGNRIDNLGFRLVRIGR